MRRATFAPRGRRNQQGFTLVEVILVVMLSTLLALPLMGWMITSIRAGDGVEKNSALTRDRNLVSVYLNRDVVSAASAALGGADCAGGDGAGGIVLLTLSTTGADPRSTAYTVVPAADGTGDVWRRVCHGGGATVSTTKVVVAAVEPLAGWATSAACAERSGRPGDVCGRVTLRFTTASGQNMESSFVRRIGGPT